MEITPDSLFFFVVLPAPKYRAAAWGYTRRGARLLVQAKQWTSTDYVEVKALSPHALTLLLHARHTAAGWRDDKETFSR